MPNICSYSMKIIGKKPNRDEFVNRMLEVDNPNHFYRIFDADIEEEGDDYCLVFGSCAWSIESCCRASGYSEGRDLLSINTKELNLKVEVWSDESGCCFQEHYIYDNGDCLVNDGRDWECFYPDYYNSVEEMNAKCDTNFTKDEFEHPNGMDGNAIEVGGFENYGEWTI